MKSILFTLFALTMAGKRTSFSQVEDKDRCEFNGFVCRAKSWSTKEARGIGRDKIAQMEVKESARVCMLWKMNADFVGIRTNNKLVFLAAQDFTFGRQSMNGLLSVPDRDGYPPSSFQMSFGHNTGNLDNSHVCKADLGLICPLNVKDTPLYKLSVFRKKIF